MLFRSRGWSRAIEDYGSFVFVRAALPGAQELAEVLARGARLADEQTLVQFNGFLIDGADAEATRTALAAISAELRAPTTEPRSGERRLRVIHFDGPIKDLGL